MAAPGIRVYGLFGGYEGPIQRQVANSGRSVCLVAIAAVVAATLPVPQRQVAPSSRTRVPSQVVALAKEVADLLRATISLNVKINNIK
jgi:hypothetical protein